MKQEIITTDGTVWCFDSFPPETQLKKDYQSGLWVVIQSPSTTMVI